MVILGIGNILQKDDGFGVYAATFLQENYNFNSGVKIINGGVEGINLLNIFLENSEVLILDTININDTPGSIYKIPADKIRGYGINSGSAHELGVIECLDILELQGKNVPNAVVLGIVPKHITFEINLSNILKKAFLGYINTVLEHLKQKGVSFSKKDNQVSLEFIINRAKDPSFALKN